MSPIRKRIAAIATALGHLDPFVQIEQHEGHWRGRVIGCIPWQHQRTADEVESAMLTMAESLARHCAASARGLAGFHRGQAAREDAKSERIEAVLRGEP